MAKGERIEVEIVAVDEASDKLDDVAVKAERLDAEHVAVSVEANTEGLEVGLREARAKTEGLSDSARGANSALANMVGNSAQDLGQFGGVVGSTGVAIGQMAEYAADATLAGEALSSSLASMAAVGGPILAMTAGMALLNVALQDNDERSKAIGENTNTFADALFRAADGGERLADVLNATTRTKVDDFLSGLGDKTRPTLEALQALGIGYDDLVRAFQDGQGPVVDALDRYRDMATEIDRIKFNEFVDTNDALILYAQRTGQTTDKVRREYEALGKLNGALGDEAELSAEGAENARLQAQFRDGVALAAQRQQDALARLNTEQDRDGQIARDKLPDLQAEEDARRRAAEQTDAHYSALARLNTEEERVNRAKLIKEEETNLRALDSAYDELFGKLDEQARRLRIVKAFEDARERLASGNLSLVEAGILINDLDRDVASYAEDVLKLPEDVTTKLIAEIDTGNLNEAEQILLGYKPSPTVQVPLEPVISLAQAQRQFGPNLTSREIGTNIPTAPGTTIGTQIINNPPGTPATTVDSFNVFITRNGERTQL